MRGKLKISDTLSFPSDCITQTFAILAKRRVGKTYTASVVAEEMADKGLPFVVLDPTGAWWGLRSSADGTKEGLPVVIIGGAHGDVPLEPTAGKVIADLVVKQPGFYVIDLSATESDAEQDRFATDFATRLYRQKEQQRDPLHLFVDEADMFAPQRPFPNQTRMLGAFEALVRRGGIRGIGVTMITQRPAILNKNVLTQCEVLIALQTTAPQDQDAIDDWIKRNGTKEQRDEMMSSLASLKKGQAWIWSPAWLDVFNLVQIRERHTFNSSATPKAGEKAVVPQKLAPIDITRLTKEIRETAEQAKQNDPRELQRKVQELQRQLNTRPVQVEPKEIIKTVEVPVLNGEVKELRGLLDKLTPHLNLLREVNDALLSVDTLLERTNLKIDKVANYKPQPQISRAIQPADRVMLRPTKPASFVVQSVEVLKPNGIKLRSGERKILQALKQFHPEPLADAKIRLLAGFNFSGKTYGTYKSVLRNKGLAEATPEGMILTQAGYDYIGDVEVVPHTTEELYSFWAARLRAGEKAILRAALDVYPTWASFETVRETLPHLSGATFNTYVSVLRGNNLIEVDGGKYRASETFFVS